MSLRAVALLVLALSPACSLPRSSVSAGDDAESATHAASASPPLATPDASAPATPPPDAFTGAWATTYGRLRLQVAGRKVRGTYASGSTSGIVEGDVDGRVLRVAYEESTGVGGRARFNLSPDGSSFHGTWRPGARTDADLDTEPTSRWDGTRVVPVKDRVWLVVLEAYWQGGLHEPDYSYGEMLGAFFERLPDVEFRQRFFSGPIDFERLAGECAELEEPVILYVSSHGGPAEIFAPGGSVTGEVIGRAVARIPNLRLLHLGACSGLAAGLPRSIRDSAGAEARFPVSGFTRNVDWGGSALVDLTYLDLVLEHGMDPVDAVEETRRLVTFAGASVPAGATIPATDLTISTP
jgi:hypothetical protein